MTRHIKIFLAEAAVGASNNSSIVIGVVYE
jgi:hypothetical protein